MSKNLFEITTRLGKNRELNIRFTITNQNPNKLVFLFNINKKNPAKRLHFIFNLIIIFFEFIINCYPVNGNAEKEFWEEENKKSKDHNNLKNYRVKVNIQYIYLIKAIDSESAKRIVEDFIKNNYEPDETFSNGIVTLKILS